MAAGCKPAAPCELRRFESSPVHQDFGLNRFSIALLLFLGLGLLAWFTLPDAKVRGVTLALLAMSALKSWLHHRRQLLEDHEQRARKLERVKLGRPM